MRTRRALAAAVATMLVGAAAAGLAVASSSGGGSGGTQVVRVQLANLHTFDMATLNHRTLVIQHN